jgi:hypothetical protein
MMDLASLTDKALIGNDSAYLLAFHEVDNGQVSPKPALEFGSDSYHAEIRAALPAGLEGGTYSFVVEGLIDDHYAMLAQSATNKVRVVRLYLFWRDTNSSIAGYLSNLAGLTDVFSAVKAADIPTALVADLRVVSVTRKAGARRYETTITARERIFETVNTSIIKTAVAVQPLPAALQAMLQQSCGFARDRDFVTYSLPTSERREFPAGRSLRANLQLLATRLEESTNQHGRGMLLIRDGKLHIGARPIPLDGAQPKKLTVGGGLIETEVLESAVSDTTFDTSNGAEAPTRRQFRLTLKGRPDLKPGDAVTFDLPPEDVTKTTGGLLGAIGDVLSSTLVPSLGDEPFKNPVNVYVSGVEHRLGRTSGFVTTVTGVEISGSSQTDFWDRHTPSSGEAPQSAPAAAPNPETAAAQAVRQLARSVSGDRLHPEVGEIRQANSEATANDPSQSVTVWRGLAPSDGGAHQARRLAIQRPSAAPSTGTPYLTPYAWGKTGLILPRYPGTRVLVVHRNGSADDAIDIGALWESGKGPDSQPGDYWLILPVGIASSRRSSIEDSAEPEEPSGKVTQDLIDADGNRVIEVGEFTLRVGRDSLSAAGERAARADDADSITIEHGGGSSIVMKSDGSITIKGKKVQIEADNDITLKASSVNVE